MPPRKASDSTRAPAPKAPAKDAPKAPAKEQTFEVLQPLHVAREGSAKGVVRVTPGDTVYAKSEKHPQGLDEDQVKRLTDLGVIK